MKTEATKHTPGPWKTGGIMTRVEVMPEGWNAPMCIADCHAKYSPKSKAERVANARLIASAPDLLDVLVAFQELDECNGGYDALQAWDARHNVNPRDGRHNYLFGRIRAAIAKATGRE